MNDQVRKRLAQWRFVSPRDIFPKGRKKVRWEEKQLKKEKEPYGDNYVDGLGLKEYPTFVKFVWDNYRTAFWTWLGSWAIVITLLTTIGAGIYFFGYSDNSTEVVTPAVKVEEIVKKGDAVPTKEVVPDKELIPTVPDDTIVIAPSLPKPKPKKVIMPKDDYDRLVEAVTMIPELKNALEVTTQALEETTGELHRTQATLNDSNTRYSELRLEHERLLLNTKGLMMDYATLQAQNTEVKAALRASEKKYDDLIDAVFD